MISYYAPCFYRIDFVVIPSYVEVIWCYWPGPSSRNKAHINDNLCSYFNISNTIRIRLQEKGPYSIGTHVDELKGLFPDESFSMFWLDCVVRVHIVNVYLDNCVYIWVIFNLYKFLQIPLTPFGFALSLSFCHYLCCDVSWLSWVQWFLIIK